jgi:hypothetical protein
MRIVFIEKGQPKNIEELAKGLVQLGQEVIVYLSNKFIPLMVLAIPFGLRIGDIYFYSETEHSSFLMRVISRLLNKPVISLERMPKEVYAFEKKCYKEYAKYFK